MAFSNYERSNKKHVTDGFRDETRSRTVTAHLFSQNIHPRDEILLRILRFPINSSCLETMGLSKARISGKGWHINV